MQQHGHASGPEAQKARIEAMKRNWDQKKRIGSHLNKIQNKIAVYSGKGGVGKTTVACNLAVLLAERGARVGLLDADIDCPNAIKILKGLDRPRMEEGTIYPAVMHGVKVISMASFQEKEDEAIIFRGPMIHNALTQFLELTDWGDLDYLIIDMPPGTSDAALTVTQILQLDGFVVVTTPQELAILDAKRSINMIKKMNVPVLGVVENMASEFFGEGGGAALAAEIDAKFLGSIPLSRSFREPPMPVVLVDPVVRAQMEKVLDAIGLPLVAA